MNVTSIADDNRKLIMFTLNAMGAKRVVVSYSGSEDSGQINDCVIDDDPTKDIEIEALQESGQYVNGQGFVSKTEMAKRKLTDVIIDYCGQIIDNMYGGCFNDDGADGQFELDVEAGTLTLTHNENYVSQNTTSHELPMTTPIDDMADAISDKKKNKKKKKGAK